MGDWMISHIMQGKLLRQTLDKFMKSPVAQEARVQVVLPNGEFYDCLLYTSPSPRDRQKSRMPSSA